MLGITVTGNHTKTSNVLKRILQNDFYSDFNRYGEMGVNALSRATPVDSSLTSRSWRYRVIRNKKRPGIEWYNTNTVNGTPVAILIQYGHATGTGGYVSGRDYINPTMRPIFDQIAHEVWKKVKT